MHMTPKRFFLPLALAAFLAACSSTPEEPDGTWVEDMVVAPSESVLWQATLSNLWRLGYPVGSQANPSAMTILTGWKTQLSPFRQKGYRLMADIRFMRAEPAADGTPAWDVDVRVKKQVNMALVKPLDPQYAEWEWSDDDEWEAAILLRHILAEFPPTQIMSSPRKADSPEPGEGNS
jgi:hypothetical protein